MIAREYCGNHRDHRPQSAIGFSLLAIRATALFLVVSALLLAAGCRSDMQNQPYQRPLAESDFYADKRAARPLVEGTVARGQERANTYFYTGRINGEDGNASSVR